MVVSRIWKSGRYSTPAGIPYLTGPPIEGFKSTVDEAPRRPPLLPEWRFPVVSEEGQINRQSMFEALADPDCRAILSTLDDPQPAKAVAETCDLPQTSTYRKLQQLSDASLVEERTEVRPDGHHATTYVRDCSGVFIAVNSDESFAVDIVRDSESPDERLARLWNRVSEEL